MATRISPKNKTYYINPAYLTFNENSGYGANLIQVSASSSCWISVYDPSNGIGYSDEDRNYKRWKVTAYNNKFPEGSDNKLFHIYVRLEAEGTAALIVYDTQKRGVKGGLITETTDENGNKVEKEEEVDEESLAYYYIRIGQVSEVNGSLREITYDTGYLTSDEASNDKSGIDEMFELDKYSTPWLIKAKQWLSSFTVKGFVKLIGGLAFSKGKDSDEKLITDIKRSTDSNEEFLLDAEGKPQLDGQGNPIPDPAYVPVSDETIPTTAWVHAQIEDADDKYLSKQKDDRSVGVVSSDKGFEVGQFTTGMIGGSGAKMYVDEHGKTVLEADKAVYREELVVPSITFNTIEVVSGDKANTFAFGRLKEVDPVTQIATLDLLSEEYGTIQERDILRGVFHNINGGNATETKEDFNGFLEYSGFFTSYFSVTQILKNEAGLMQFRYVLQEDDNGDPICPHPCAGMKFYAYGNFTEEERQSITYETRDYKRRLVKMDSWNIIPTKNIVMQDGKLDGLTIGGFSMSGYGTFQTNSYFTGIQMQFTPDQLENLKGEDAYSVELSSYEGLLKVDIYGNITSGMTSTQNVVTGGMNVVNKDGNVVTTTFNLRTTIQAFKGNKPLFYSTEVGAGSYIADLRMKNCDGYILNGSVIITEIKDITNCSVVVVVNCEGKLSFEKVYHINAVYDGQSSEIETIYSTKQEPKNPEEVHPYPDDDDWTHNKTKDNMWMAMATKKNDVWDKWQVTRIKGFDGYDFKVLPETTVIGRTLTDSYSPSSIHLTCYRVGAGERTPTEATWRIERYDGTEWHVTNFSATDVSSIDFGSFNKDYKAYRFYAIPKEYDKVEAMASAVLSEDGKSGQMARYRGRYKEGETYVWDAEYRDIMVYEGNAYQVKSLPSKIYADTNVPDLTLWNPANKFDFVAMDTALISGANIAGFTFTVKEFRNGVPYGILASANNHIELDAVNETIKATNGIFKGDLYGKTISFEELAHTSNEYFLPPINGRYGMFYMDNVVGRNTMYVGKTFVADGDDVIVRITGSTEFSESGAVTITNQETIFFYSAQISGKDKWIATILPYWIFGKEPNQSIELSNIQEIEDESEATEPDVLYILK